MHSRLDPRRVVMIIACAMLPAAPVLAQWSGKGEAGVALASGNSDSQSANARLQVVHKRAQWENSAGLAGNYVSDSEGTTAQRVEFIAQTRYEFSPRTYTYGALRYENDRFSGFDYQGTASSGVGRKFIDTDTTKLMAQLGAGFRVAETRDTIDPDTLLIIPGDRDSSVVGVGSAEFTHAFNASTAFFDKLGLEVASDNTFVQNEIGVAVKMTDRMALAVALAVRYNTDPPPAFKKTDTLTTVNLVYEVK